MGKLAFNISVANTKRIDVETILDFLEANHTDISTFRKVIPVGQPRADAFQYLAVLGALGSVASIASLLWDAYEKLIAPTKGGESDNAGLMISIDPIRDRHTKLFWIGGTYKTREDFVRDFENVLEQFDADEKGYSAAVDQLMADSRMWLPRSYTKRIG